jgi:hypothetical protein
MSEGSMRSGSCSREIAFVIAALADAQTRIIRQIISLVRSRAYSQ